MIGLLLAVAGTLYLKTGRPVFLALFWLRPELALAVAPVLARQPRQLTGWALGLPLLLASGEASSEPISWSLLTNWLVDDFPGPEGVWAGAVGRALTVLALGRLWLAQKDPQRALMGCLAAGLLLGARDWTSACALVPWLPRLMIPLLLAAALGPLGELALWAALVGVLLWTTPRSAPSRRQVWLLGALSVSVGALALNLPEPHSSLRLMGWEYGSIGRALAQGYGFSDAMGPGAGPTAWMPPLLCFVYAGFYKLSSQPVWLALGFQIACLVLALALVLEAVERSGCPSAPLYPWLLLYGCLDSGAWLADNHDVPLTICLSLLVLLSCWDLWDGTRRTRALVTALLVGFANPALAMAYGVILLALRRRSTLLVLLALVLPATGWAVRNQLVLGQPYILKSNLWYDFCQANLMDADGVPTGQTFVDFQPCNNNPARREYYRLGEVGFLELYRIQAAEIMPAEWLRRIGRRGVNALLWLQPTQDLELAAPLPVSDQLLLLQAHLLYDVGGGRLFWIDLAQSLDQLRSRLAQLPLSQPQRVCESWRRAADFNRRRQNCLVRQLWSLAHGALPFLALLAGCWRRAVRQNPGFQLTLLLYALILTPYLLISHYERYQLGLSGLQILLVFYGTQALTRVPNSESSPLRSHTE